MNTKLNLAALAAISLLAFAPAANAQIYITADTTINYAINDNVIVGYGSDSDLANQTDPASPVINLVAGGNDSYSLSAYNSSTINVNGGSIGSGLYVYDNSTVNANVGSISGLSANNNSTVNVNGSSINGDLIASNNSTVNVNSGSFYGDLYIIDNGTVNLFGSSISGALYGYGGTFNFFGSNLSDTLTNPDDGGFSDYALSGTLADGTLLTGKVLSLQNGSNATFAFNPGASAVPEPGSVALLAGMTTVGAGVLRRRRK